MGRPVTDGRASVNRVACPYCSAERTGSDQTDRDAERKYDPRFGYDRFECGTLLYRYENPEDDVGRSGRCRERTR